MNVTQTNFLYRQNVHIWRSLFVVRTSAQIKNILMQIWKLPYMFVFIQKQYPESLSFLFPRTLKLFAPEVCKFLEK